MGQSADEARWREVIETWAPELRHAGNLRRARLLRRWAHESTPFCGPGATMEEAFGERISYEAAAVLLPVLACDRGGFQCAGTAYVLRAAYNLFDLEAFTYNMGLARHELSHCVTLVRVRDGDTEGILVEDAHFDTELQIDGRPGTFDSLLDALSMGRQAHVTHTPHEGGRRLGIVALDHEEEIAREWVEYYEGAWLRTHADRAVYELTFSLPRFRYRHLYEAEMLHRFGNRNLASLLLLPIGTSGEAPAQEMARRARLVASNLRRPHRPAV